MTEPTWVEHAVWWQLYPLGFTGADPTGVDRSPGGGLRQVAGYLDYAVRLGASGIALGPIFDSTSHGYDTSDYYRIDQRLGSDADFDLLVAEAASRGLRLLLDGVFNHVGPEFPAPEGWLKAGAVFEGHSGLLELDHANPAVAAHVVDVMCHWLDRGAHGWRLDAAYAVPPAFWAVVLPRVRERHPDAYLVGEVIHGDYAEIVAASTLDSVTQYELWKAIWSSLNDGNFFELAWALERHNGWLADFVPMTFLGNHDVTRIASRLEDPRHLAHALAVLMTIGGTPSLYYGDERGATGLKEDRAGGDDAVRPAWPVDPAELSGGDDVLRLHQELIGLRRRHSWLHRATTTKVTLTNEQLVYDTAYEGQTLRVALNLADTELKLPAGQAIAGNATPRHAGLVVPSHGWAIVEP
jgi:cyclomaltodextrinase